MLCAAFVQTNDSAGTLSASVVMVGSPIKQKSIMWASCTSRMPARSPALNIKLIFLQLEGDLIQAIGDPVERGIRRELRQVLISRQELVQCRPLLRISFPDGPGVDDQAVRDLNAMGDGDDLHCFKNTYPVFFIHS